MHNSHIIKQIDHDKWKKKFIDTTIRDYDKKYISDHVDRFTKSRER